MGGRRRGGVGGRRSRFFVDETWRTRRERVLEVGHGVLVERVVVLRGYTTACFMTS